MTSTDLVIKIVPLLICDDGFIEVDGVDTCDDVRLVIRNGKLCAEVLIEQDYELSDYAEFDEEYFHQREDEIQIEKVKDLVELLGDEG